MPVIIYEVYSYLVIGSWFLAVFSERKLPIRIILAVPKSAKLSIIVRNILVDVFLVHKSAAVNVLSPSFGWCALKMHFLCTLEGINFFPFSSIIGHIFPRIKFFYESSFGLQLAEGSGEMRNFTRWYYKRRKSTWKTAARDSCRRLWSFLC